MKILFAIPCYGGNMNAETAGSLFFAGKMLDQKGIQNALYVLQNESFIPNARNRIAAEFMMSDFTHLMCIDSDIGFAPQSIISLVEAGKDFVAGTYRKKTEKVSFTVSDLKTMDQIESVEYVGLGFSLISRNVFEKLDQTVEKLKPQQHWNIVRYITNYYGPIIQDGEMLAEDVSFCQRCINNQIDIFVDKSIILTHYGQFGYK